MSQEPVSRVLSPRQRVRRVLDHREPDRVPIYNEVSAEALAYWHEEQGSPEEGIVAPFTPHFEICTLEIDLSPRYPVQTVEETDVFIDAATPFGGIRRIFRGRPAPPRMMQFGVRTRTEWTPVRRRLEASDERVDWPAFRREYQQACEDDLYIALRAIGGLDFCENCMGIDGLRSGLISDPGWVRDMAETYADLLVAMAERILEAGYDIDAVFLLSGLAGRTAPRIPPRDYVETFAPVDRRVAGFFHGRGMKVLLYSPGDLRILVPDLIDAGVDCLGPCQVAAGMDVRVLKVNYGADLSMLGGIDVRALLQPDAVLLEREIAYKVSDAMIGGGYIAGFDGPIPAEAAPSRYQLALDLLNRFGKY